MSNPQFFFQAKIVYGSHTGTAEIGSTDDLQSLASNVIAAVLTCRQGSRDPGLYMKRDTSWVLILSFVDLCNALTSAFSFEIYAQLTIPITMPTASVVYKNGKLKIGLDLNESPTDIYTVLKPVTGGSALVPTVLNKFTQSIDFIADETSVSVTHGLGTFSLIVSFFELDTGQNVIVDWRVTDSNTIVVSFGIFRPISGDIIVTILG